MPEPVATIPPDARPLGPGLYAIGAELHVDASALLSAHGYDPNTTNERTLARVIRDVCRSEGIEVAP